MTDYQKSQLVAAAATVQDLNNGRLIVVGYGSLPNKPEQGMKHLRPVTIPGYRKELCVRVTTCRGSPTQPGLVAGIIPDGQSSAMAMLSEASTEDRGSLLDALAQRELNGKAYSAQVIGTLDQDGNKRAALAFVADTVHSDFWRGTCRQAAKMVAVASGACGQNADYLRMLLEFERSTFGKCTQDIARVLSAVQSDSPIGLHRAGGLSNQNSADVQL